eukprot:TRINITY_DN3983_c0_g1_i2.p2 TRINITY_DN3983_c0_g1~~TRINITY_DN3983_c0_g1_i2.p2  ORF type:complete len:189 (+),score=38.89 TRINITY_DN3983_c0_g1_i2:732-1298(+)
MLGGFVEYMNGVLLPFYIEDIPDFMMRIYQAFWLEVPYDLVMACKGDDRMDMIMGEMMVDDTVQMDRENISDFEYSEPIFNSASPFSTNYSVPVSVIPKPTLEIEEKQQEEEIFEIDMTAFKSKLKSSRRSLTRNIDFNRMKNRVERPKETTPPTPNKVIPRSTTKQNQKPTTAPKPQPKPRNRHINF